MRRLPAPSAGDSDEPLVARDCHLARLVGRERWLHAVQASPWSPAAAAGRLCLADSRSGAQALQTAGRRTARWVHLRRLPCLLQRLRQNLAASKGRLHESTPCTGDLLCAHGPSAVKMACRASLPACKVGSSEHPKCLASHSQHTATWALLPAGCAGSSPLRQRTPLQLGQAALPLLLTIMSWLARPGRDAMAKTRADKSAPAEEMSFASKGPASNAECRAADSSTERSSGAASQRCPNSGLSNAELHLC